MRRPWRALGALALVGLVLWASGRPAYSRQNEEKKHLLYFTMTTGFRHSSVSFSHPIVMELGRKSGKFEVTVTEDIRLINAEVLRYFDAVMFNTTGNLPFSDAQRAALLDFVRSGKGFIGVHAATDTCYDWPEFGELIGGYFDGHPWSEEVTIRVEDRTHPSTRHLGDTWVINDEIYQFKNWSRDRVHVLLSLDNTKLDLNRGGINRQDKDFGVAWIRDYGRGRSFYTSLGHREEVWANPVYQEHLLRGILWAMGEE